MVKLGKSTPSAKKPTKQSENKKPRRNEYDDDDDGDRPSKASKKSKSGGTVEGGWGAYKKAREATSSYLDGVKLTKDDTVVKFLTDAPVSGYVEHWINDRKGKKSFVCAKSVVDPRTGKLHKKCPLCDIGIDDRAKTLFPVAVLAEGTEPALSYINAGPQLTDLISDTHNNKRSGPIDKFYYAMTSTYGDKNHRGKGTYTMAKIKAADLEDEWDMAPLTPKEEAALLKEFNVEDAIGKIPTIKELQDIANEITGDFDDDFDDDGDDSDD